MLGSIVREIVGEPVPDLDTGPDRDIVGDTDAVFDTVTDDVPVLDAVVVFVADALPVIVDDAIMVTVASDEPDMVLEGEGRGEGGERRRERVHRARLRAPSSRACGAAALGTLRTRSARPTASRQSCTRACPNSAPSAS